MFRKEQRSNQDKAAAGRPHVKVRTFSLDNDDDDYVRPHVKVRTFSLIVLQSEL